jgi:hypothetical protein
MAQIFYKTGFDGFAQGLGFGHGDAAGDTPVDVVGGLLVAFGVLFQQDVERELLRRNQEACCGGSGTGFNAVVCHGPAFNGAADRAAQWWKAATLAGCRCPGCDVPQRTHHSLRGC